jgi:hypothetical protein
VPEFQLSETVVCHCMNCGSHGLQGTWILRRKFDNCMSGDHGHQCYLAAGTHAQLASPNVLLHPARLSCGTSALPVAQPLLYRCMHSVQQIRPAPPQQRPHVARTVPHEFRQLRHAIHILHFTLSHFGCYITLYAPLKQELKPVSGP